MQSDAERATITDQELVRGILEGSAAHFEVLHERYRERIYRFALKRLGDPAEAEDVTQEVFLQVFRCLGSFQGRSSLLTWMFGIAHNRVCRRFRRPTPVTISIEAPEAASLASREPAADRLIEAVRLLERCSEVVETELSSSQRRAFHMRYGESQSTRAIAERLGKTNQAVKIGLFRSRRLLAERAAGADAALSA